MKCFSTAIIRMQLELKNKMASLLYFQCSKSVQKAIKYNILFSIEPSKKIYKVTYMTVKKQSVYK